MNSDIKKILILVLVFLMFVSFFGWSNDAHAQPHISPQISSSEVGDQNDFSDFEKELLTSGFKGSRRHRAAASEPRR